MADLVAQGVKQTGDLPRVVGRDVDDERPEHDRALARLGFDGRSDTAKDRFDAAELAVVFNQSPGVGFPQCAFVLGTLKSVSVAPAELESALIDLHETEDAVLFSSMVTATLALCALLGLVNAFGLTVIGIPSFIMTLAMMQIAAGVSALLVSTSKQMPLCVQELDKRGIRIPVLIGGAAINRRFGRRAMFVNAEQAMAEVSRERVLILRTRHTADGAAVSVIDNGTGISPPHLEPSFDPFFTTKPPGEGTGLGLSISYGIVKFELDGKHVLYMAGWPAHVGLYPIMGAAAFVMAEFLAVSYFQVTMWAIIPAFLYYVAVFFAVHFESKRVGLLGLPRADIPRLGKVLRERHDVLGPRA